jgi:hypothetical protein
MLVVATNERVDLALKQLPQLVGIGRAALFINDAAGVARRDPKKGGRQRG